MNRKLKLLIMFVLFVCLALPCSTEKAMTSTEKGVLKDYLELDLGASSN